jgi:hypothetical protein
MSAAMEAYQRLLDAQRHRPTDDDMHAWEAERKREDERLKIKRRLPKVA